MPRNTMAHKNKYYKLGFYVICKLEVAQVDMSILHIFVWAIPSEAVRDGLRYDWRIGDAIIADNVLDLQSLFLGLLQYPLNIASAFETTEEEIVGHDDSEATQEIRLTKVLLLLDSSHHCKWSWGQQGCPGWLKCDQQLFVQHGRPCGRC